VTASLPFALMAAAGYGDLDPVTFARRFAAVARIAWGLGLLGFVGALLAAWFVGRARRGSEAPVERRSRGTFRLLAGSILTVLAAVWLLSSIATDPAFGGGTIAGIAVSLPVLNVGLLLLVQGRNQRRRFRAIPLDRIR
jgi:hypothetical protein